MYGRNNQKASPFTLRGGAGASEEDKAPAKVYSPEDQAKLLAGYMEVPRMHWPFIEFGTGIRYYLRNEETNAEEFKYGGYVSLNTIPSSGADGNDQHTIWVCSSPSGNAARWRLSLDRITRIFIRPNASSLVLIDSIKTLTTNIDGNIKKLAEYAKRLEERVTTLERRH